jgi:hypothetical protein
MQRTSLSFDCPIPSLSFSHFERVVLSTPIRRANSLAFIFSSCSRKGWQVQFLEPDLKTPLPKTFTFSDPEKIRELARYTSLQ